MSIQVQCIMQVYNNDPVEGNDIFQMIVIFLLFAKFCAWVPQALQDFPQSNLIFIHFLMRTSNMFYEYASIFVRQSFSITAGAILISWWCDSIFRNGWLLFIYLFIFQVVWWRCPQKSHRTEQLHYSWLKNWAKPVMSHISELVSILRCIISNQTHCWRASTHSGTFSIL